MSEPNFQFDLEKALDQPPKTTLRDPFGSKDTSAYFASEEGNQQLALLEHLSRYSNLLSVVLGPKGSGKSRFLMEFARNQDDSTIISEVKATMLMTAGQLLQAIYGGFSKFMKEPPNEATFGPLLKFSHDLESRGQKALVLIDNAQELNTDAITMLLDMMSLATENQSVPHVALFTEQSLGRNLDAYQRTRYEQLSHSLTMMPYSLEQTRAYLLHRVRAVGGNINLPFNDKQIKQIHHDSGGYPGPINEIAQAMMGNGGKPPKKGRFNIALGFPLVHMALLCVVMLGILVAVLFNGSGADKNEDVFTTKESNVIPLSPPKVASQQKTSTSATMAKIDEMQRKIGEGKISLPPIPAEPKEDQVTSVQPSMTQSVPTAPIRNEAPQAKPAPTIAPSSETGDSTVASSTPVPVAVSKESVDVDKSADPFNKTQWWLTQNPRDYTLQLLGTYSLSTVKDFIKDQGSISVFSYFKTKHKGRDWYVVVYGLYSNRSEAISASESLPKDLRKLDPWSRSVRGIQQDIKKAE